MVEAIGTTEAALLTALIAVGCLFLTVGTVGLLRFPNVYNRMHATSKPTTLGTAAILGAAFVRFGPGGDGLASLLAIAFLFLTVPTGAHMIARSAERMGVPFEAGVTWPAPPGVDDDRDAADTVDARTGAADGSTAADDSTGESIDDDSTDVTTDADSTGDSTADDSTADDSTADDSTADGA